MSFDHLVQPLPIKQDELKLKRLIELFEFPPISEDNNDNETPDQPSSSSSYYYYYNFACTHCLEEDDFNNSNNNNNDNTSIYSTTPPLSETSLTSTTTTTDTMAIPSPNLRETIYPVLASLPHAASSTEPLEACFHVLDLPVRNRVRTMSSSSRDPWIRWLSYADLSSPIHARLRRIAKSSALELHPVSGEIEIDWASRENVLVRFRRRDVETLEAMVVLREVDGLWLKLVWVEDDWETAVHRNGEGRGWRVREVGAASGGDIPAVKEVLEDFGGCVSIAEAEEKFASSPAPAATQTNGAHPTITIPIVQGPTSGTKVTVENLEDAAESSDDDAYWARYDTTPGSRTPLTGNARHRSPAAPRSVPVNIASAFAGTNTTSSREKEEEEEDDDEDAYFAQYDDVQPAMDHYDAEEERRFAESIRAKYFG